MATHDPPPYAGPRARGLEAFCFLFNPNYLLSSLLLLIRRLGDASAIRIAAGALKYTLYARMSTHMSIVHIYILWRVFNIGGGW